MRGGEEKRLVQFEDFVYYSEIASNCKLSSLSHGCVFLIVSLLFLSSMMG